MNRVLIKLGGAALDGAGSLACAAEAIASYRELGYQVILVHGGGPAINAELARRGITWSFINGQRVTTTEMISVIEMVLCGGVNRRLVRFLSSVGLPVVGFSGADQNTLFCRQASLELGQVGAIQTVNTGWIEELMSQSDAPVPVIAPLGIGAGGECFNINADWAAAHLAATLKVEQLIFLTDQPGILDEEGQVISTVTSAGLKDMIQCKVVSGGMLAKAQATVHALERGVPTVRILKGQDAVTDISNGTLCVLQTEEFVAQGKEVHAAI